MTSKKTETNNDPAPLGVWREEERSYGMITWIWECPFCGYRRRSSTFEHMVKTPDDYPTEEFLCYHCWKDADGKVSWQLYRTGSCGYYGDGDFEWDGGYRGKKDVLIHRPLDSDRTGWYGESTVPYDIPDIHLEVYAWTRGGEWIKIDDDLWKRKRRRIHAYSATLKFKYWVHRQAPIVTAKRVKTLKQIYKEVEELDFTSAIAEMLKSYYSQEMTTCVWKHEDGQWVPFMTSFGAISGLDLPIGKYATWDRLSKKYSRIERGLWGSGGWSSHHGPDVVEDPPTPWIDYGLLTCNESAGHRVEDTVTSQPSP